MSVLRGPLQILMHVSVLTKNSFSAVAELEPTSMMLLLFEALLSKNSMP